MRLCATWRGLFCRLGLVKHTYQRREQFFPGRRRRTATRRADPPGWGYVLEWFECPDCLGTVRISARECWVWDYVPGTQTALPSSGMAAQGGSGE